MFTVWHGLFSWVLMFSGLGIEASAHPQYRVSVLQGKYIYTFLTWRTSIFNFWCYVLNLVKNNIFFQRLVVPGSIYRSTVLSEYLQFGQFIGQVCQNSNRAGRFIDQTCLLDNIFRPIYWLTTATGLTFDHCWDFRFILSQIWNLEI